MYIFNCTSDCMYMYTHLSTCQFPKGAPNVVSSRDAVSSSKCRKPLRTSAILKTCACDRAGKTSVAVKQVVVGNYKVVGFFDVSAMMTWKAQKLLIQLARYLI